MWLTLSEIAAQKHLTFEAAHELVRMRRCPCIFRASGVAYLIG